MLQHSSVRSTAASDEGGPTEVHEIEETLPTSSVMLTPCPDPALAKFYEGLPFLSYVFVTILIF